MSSLASTISSVFQNVIGDVAEDEIVQFIADAYNNAHSKAENDSQQFRTLFIAEVNDVMGDATNQFAATLFQQLAQNEHSNTNANSLHANQHENTQIHIPINAQTANTISEQQAGSESAGAGEAVTSSSASPNPRRMVSLRSSSSRASLPLKALDAPLHTSSNKDGNKASNASTSPAASTSAAISSQPSVPPSKSRKSLGSSSSASNDSDSAKKRRLVSLTRSSNANVPDSLQAVLESGKKELRKKKFQKDDSNVAEENADAQTQNSANENIAPPQKRRRQFGNGKQRKHQQKHRLNPPSDRFRSFFTHT